jgi:hypothetical protein
MPLNARASTSALSPGSGMRPPGQNALVQNEIMFQTGPGVTPERVNSPALLTGRLFDEHGHRMTPTHTAEP